MKFAVGDVVLHAKWSLVVSQGSGVVKKVYASGFVAVQWAGSAKKTSHHERALRLVNCNGLDRVLNIME